MYQLASDAPDPIAIGNLWGGNWKRALQHALDVREQRHPDRFIDIWYRDVASDPVGQVRRIHDAIGRPLSDEAVASVAKWAEANRRENRPPHEYTMEKFGFTEAQLAEDFRGYRERFILPREG